MKSGLDLVSREPARLGGLGRVGLVTNQAAVASDLRTAVEVVAAACSEAPGTTLTCLFGPQHGYGQTEQDNMIETPHSVLQVDGRDLPLWSLYGTDRAPQEAQLEDVDTLVVDLQDVGCRIYTYMLTLAGCLRAAAKTGKRVLVLDRPNPLGLSYPDPRDPRQWHRVEGNPLDLRLESFVGWYPIPMRHGLTLGELGTLFVRLDNLSVDYQVICVPGLRRSGAQQAGDFFPWVLPSPNLPSHSAAVCFPSFVALEGTNLSEGRGTTTPFQLVGAPYLDTRRVAQALEDVWAGGSLGGPSFLTKLHEFRPTFNKHAGERCQGLYFQPRASFDGVRLFDLGIWFLAAVTALHPDKVVFLTPGRYEYNLVDAPLDLILGSGHWRKLLEEFRTRGYTSELRERLSGELLRASHQAGEFAAMAKECAHLYPV